jgi:hypothetical protein
MPAFGHQADMIKMPANGPTQTSGVSAFVPMLSYERTLGAAQTKRA